MELVNTCLSQGNLCYRRQIWGWCSLKTKFFFFFLRLLEKSKTFSKCKSSGVLQNHTDEMGVDEVKPVGFFLCSFAGHKYISACYLFLRLW